jgi:hypothetical protein
LFLIFCSKVVDAIKYEVKKIQEPQRPIKTDQIKPTLPDCDSKFELAKISLKNCSRFNSGVTKTLLRFTNELINLRDNCSTGNSTHYMPKESSFATQGRVLTDCDVAIRETLGNVAKCHNDSFKLAAQIAEVNKTLVAERCKCGITCFYDTKHENQYNKAGTLMNTNVALGSFSQTVQPNNISPFKQGVTNGLQNKSLQNNVRSHITDEMRPSGERPFEGQNLRSDFKPFMPTAVGQMPKLTALQILKPMELEPKEASTIFIIWVVSLWPNLYQG